MHLRYAFRVYPTGPQQVALARTFGCVRTVYNDAVAVRRVAWREGLPYPSTTELDRRLITLAKRTTERAWLAEVSTVPLQQALRDCATAYANFFASLSGKRPGPKVGPPQYKRRAHTQAARFTKRGFSLRRNGRLSIAKVGDLKVAWSRELPSLPSSVTIVKTPTGKYFASFVVAVDESADVTVPIDDPDAETGIDLGLKSFAVLRGGKVIENPKFFRKLERKIRRAQRVLSRKQKGSRNRAKARVKLAQIHEKIRNRRDDWLDKQVVSIVAENQGIYVEDLNVKGLSRGRASKSVQDAAFGAFLRKLESKAARAGRSFARVDRYFPSTQLCSACGALTGPKGLEGLAIRVWRCDCGAVHDRDMNAELNIRREGQRLSRKQEVAAGLAETQNASGGQVRPGTPGTARKTPNRGRNEEPIRTPGAHATG